MPCPFSSVKHDLSRLNFPTDLSSLTSPSYLSCLHLPSPVVTSWPSCDGCHVPVVLSQLSCLPVLYCPSYLLSLVKADLSKHYLSGRPVRLSYPSCPIPAGLSWLPCHDCPVLAVPSCHILAVMKSLSCPGCPAKVVLSCLSCPW